MLPFPPDVSCTALRLCHLSSHSRDPIPFFIIYCTTIVGGGGFWLVPSLVLFTEEETEAASRTSQDNRLTLSPENWALPMDSPELRFKAQQKRFNVLSSRQRPRGPSRQDTKPAGRGHLHQCVPPYLLQPPPRPPSHHCLTRSRSARSRGTSSE